MKDVEQFIDSLLWEEEGPSLDFKRERYPFAQASEDAKSELLKDVLAFTNAWRRTDAYIVLGVREVAGAKNEVVGVTEHLEDAALQQFVNSKTQRPVDLSYLTGIHGGKDVGLIRIPVQERPVYLRQSYGHVKREVVYVRRGSSTAEASPDEIARMGLQAVLSVHPAPELTVGLASSKYKHPEGLKARIRVRHLTVPSKEEVPDYKDERGARSLMSLPLVDAPNEDYFRELVEYVRAAERWVGFCLSVANEGSTVANDVRVEATADRSNGLRLVDSTALPATPHRTRSSFLDVADIPAIAEISRDLWVRRVGDQLIVAAELGKLQPGGRSRTADRLLVGAAEAGLYQILVKLFCDELPKPVETVFQIEIEVVEEKADLARIVQLAEEEFLESDSYREYQESAEDPV